MRTIKTILVPLDFSAASGRALGYARELADECGATLHLLHVFEDPFAAGGFMDMYTPAPDEFVERREVEARKQLESLLTEAEKHQYSAVFAARMGLPAEQILAYVQEHGAIDLIVIATSSRGRVARLMTGSVAHRIVRSAPCPVLALHPHDRLEAGEESRAA
jgi:universal stress protein A